MRPVRLTLLFLFYSIQSLALPKPRFGFLRSALKGRPATSRATNLRSIARPGSGTTAKTSLGPRFGLSKIPKPQNIKLPDLRSPNLKGAQFSATDTKALTPSSINRDAASSLNPKFTGSNSVSSKSSSDGGSVSSVSDIPPSKKGVKLKGKNKPRIATKKKDSQATGKKNKKSTKHDEGTNAETGQTTPNVGESVSIGTTLLSGALQNGATGEAAAPDAIDNTYNNAEDSSTEKPPVEETTGSAATTRKEEYYDDSVAEVV